MKIRTATVLGLAAVALLACASYFSPHWTMHQMRSAIRDGDADSFSEHVDFPALRDSFKGQMVAMMSTQLQSPEMRDNPFSKLGQTMAVALINPMVDAMVSPAGVIMMMKNGSAKPSAIEKETGSSDIKAENGEMPSYAVTYKGWSRVAIRPTTHASGGFILRRHGLWTWKLSAVEIPGDSFKKEP